jgi:hypothetical protein
MSENLFIDISDKNLIVSIDMEDAESLRYIVVPDGKEWDSLISIYESIQSIFKASPKNPNYMDEIQSLRKNFLNRIKKFDSYDYATNFSAPKKLLSFHV